MSSRDEIKLNLSRLCNFLSIVHCRARFDSVGRILLGSLGFSRVLGILLLGSLGFSRVLGRLLLGSL